MSAPRGRASRGVALASTVGYSGLLGGPPAIGFLAEHAGLPAALVSVPLLAVVAAGLSLAVAQQRPRLTLPARGDDQHFVARQAHRLVEPDRRREILQIAGCLGDPQDPVERAAGNAHLAPGLTADAPDRLQPRRIGREGRDQHPALGLQHLRQEPRVNAFFRARWLVLEDVGRIAHQRQHTRVADLG